MHWTVLQSVKASTAAGGCLSHLQPPGIKSQRMTLDCSLAGTRTAFYTSLLLLKLHAKRTCPHTCVLQAVMTIRNGGFFFFIFISDLINNDALRFCCSLSLETTVAFKMSFYWTLCCWVSATCDWVILGNDYSSSSIFLLDSVPSTQVLFLGGDVHLPDIEIGLFCGCVWVS